MGYFIGTTDTDFHIRKENFAKGYELLCRLNERDDLKSGRLFGGPPTPKPEGSRSVSDDPNRWFRWMNWNYDETCRNLDEILNQLGFHVVHENTGLNAIDDPGDIIDLGMENWKGDEEVFLNALAPVVEDGSYLTFRGENGDHWRYVFRDGRMDTLQGRIVFDE